MPELIAGREMLLKLRSLASTRVLRTALLSLPSSSPSPILGPTEVDGLVLATGHHRNGILLTPVTAQMIARMVLTGETDVAIAPFGLARFTPARAAE